MFVKLKFKHIKNNLFLEDFGSTSCRFVLTHLSKQAKKTGYYKQTYNVDDEKFYNY